jgi:biopolymer transport protein ExbD
MRSSHTKTHNNEAEVDLTPMLDIVFIMLIFFIVTASFVQETGLRINHPPNSPPQPQAPTDVIGFQIDANDRLFFAGRHVDIWSAEAIIKQQSTENPKAPVVMQVEQGARLKTLLRLYDAALTNGVPRGRVAVLTKS